MKKTQLPFSETGYFSQIILDYLNEDDFLQNFYSHQPELSSFEQAIQDKKKEKINRELLVHILQLQYHSLDKATKVSENISLLKNENTFCIVTAHQLNLFTGPLYVIYKTVTAIKTCIQLKEAYPQYHFVPVFWLGSEDHDFEEINHTNLFSKKLQWQTEQTGATGRFSLNGIEQVLLQLKEILGTGEHAQKIYSVFETAYLQSETLSEAAIKYLHALFSEYGLLVIDGDHSQFKEACSKIIQDELINKSSYSIVNKSISELSKKYPAQAAPRELNFFYLSEGKRERIVFDSSNNKYSILNTLMSFTEHEILEHIQNHPENFSPNVILRPLFQQKILPALAYIGGGGEIAYWLELKQLFNHHQIAFPVLLLRNSAVIIDQAISSKKEKLQITASDLFLKEDDLIKTFISKHASQDLSLLEEKKQIDAMFETIAAIAKTQDATLEQFAKAEKQSVINILEKISSRFLKAEKQKSETSIQQLKTIKSKLFPEGGLQERNINFMQFYVTYGDAFIQELIEAFDVFDKNFLLLFPEK